MAAITTATSERFQFAFINITNPKDLTHADNQRTIRRHAWDAGRPHKRRRRRNYTFGLSDFHPPATDYTSITPVKQVNNDRDSQKDEGLKKYLEEAERIPPSQYLSIDCLRPLGAGRGLDPLAPFPIPSNSRIVQLIDFAQKDSGQMRIIWISVAMSDRSAFQVSLAHSALLMARQDDSEIQENDEALKYYTNALNSVNNRLCDPTDNTSEGIIGAILGFCCYDCVRENFSRLQMHLDGLERVVQRRGGIETLQSPPLRIMVNWIDVTGSMLLDTLPRFPVPKEFVHVPNATQQSPGLTASIQVWNDRYPSFKDISSVLVSIASLSSEVNRAATNPQFWRDELFIGVRLNPVVHQLLMLPRFNLPEQIETGLGQGLLIREIVRLALMVFLGLLKRQFRIQPDGISKHGRRLAQLLTAYSFDWYSLTNLHLWALIISTIVEEDRGILVARIVDVMSDTGVVDWHDALLVIKDIAWIDEVATHVIYDVGSEISFHLKNGY